MPRAKKTAFPRYTDLPDRQHQCFTDAEWNEWWNYYYKMMADKKRHPNVYAVACEDCDLSYQMISMMNGTCLPPDPAATPAARYFETGNSETEELPLVNVR